MRTLNTTFSAFFSKELQASNIQRTIHAERRLSDGSQLRKILKALLPGEPACSFLFNQMRLKFHDSFEQSFLEEVKKTGVLSLNAQFHLERTSEGELTFKLSAELKSGICGINITTRERGANWGDRGYPIGDSHVEPVLEQGATVSDFQEHGLQALYKVLHNQPNPYADKAESFITFVGSDVPGHGDTQGLIWTDYVKAGLVQFALHGPDYLAETRVQHMVYQAKVAVTQEEPAYA